MTKDKGDLITRARAFAIAAHVNDRYGDLPYEYHLKAVVKELESIAFHEYSEYSSWPEEVSLAKREPIPKNLLELRNRSEPSGNQLSNSDRRAAHPLGQVCDVE